MVDGGPQAPDRMTVAQAARRRRVLTAVVELVRERAVGDIAMKDIADRSGVALGTIYRYFSSKDHVLAAALAGWAAGLDKGGRRSTRAGELPAERLAAVLRRALRAYEREPAFARLLIEVIGSDDPFASAAVATMGDGVFAALDRAAGDGIRADDRDEVMAIIGAVWYHGLAEWVKGRRTIDDVRSSLESAVRLLVRDPAVVGGPPDG